MTQEAHHHLDDDEEDDDDLQDVASGGLGLVVEHRIGIAEDAELSSQSELPALSKTVVLGDTQPPFRGQAGVEFKPLCERPVSDA